ncbi:cyclase [Embleya scabrispora]|uniref:Cyclase n=1 Tax=Embleya scabrispora TaxID=159449 RepID=A0A1T3P125_9ACTN|nr:cyclase [Embleya scabrispora]
MLVTTVQHSIDVDVPVRTAYNQWTQFREFPRFMSGVERIDQINATHTHWVTKIAGVTREFDAEITEQRPDERVAWKTVDGPHQAGVVTFHRLDDVHTRVMFQMEFDPDGLVETVGDKLGFVRGRTKGDLEHFKTFVEERGQETGGWRGEVEPPGSHGSADLPQTPPPPYPGPDAMPPTPGRTGAPGGGHIPPPRPQAPPTVGGGTQGY